MPEANEFHWGTGRRKTGVARVRILAGTGKIVVNDRDYLEYFPAESDRIAVVAPLKATKAETRFDVFAECTGGGISGQAGAVVLGIARALKKADPSLEPALRAGAYLTRDSRMKERKKYGQKGARARFQFSKR
ncbi:MAG: 30S ribosomal protein S9 [Planctomycetes bacterium]|nr:30S ribosomal protein S9 [Planctomycetota bacterium]